MEIVFAKNIGFCSGVKKAILIAENSLEKDKRPIQFLGSLVHNQKVLDKFKNNGVRFIKKINEANSGTLIIQAHGIPPLTIKNNRLILRDATCPLVKKVQLAAKNLYNEGYKVIIIGDKKHSETRGVKGYTKNKAIIIENKEQAKKISKFKKMGVVAQTTQNLKNVNEILIVLKGKAEELKYIDTLCPEVQTRQKELNSILKKADGILVIGSRLSANTQRLAEIAKKNKKPVWLINSSKEIKTNAFEKVSVLGVVSGASSPDWIIKDISAKLKSR
ncbi:MAG: 4-hydroxy-3-methylbut-2-enyl diphosphate reductase [Candidatus Nealsonbacteria bacterium]|nr:4-hydroxy-3-methylbut-2-enyl diphosphate reductase [Candidatus Nealsonbacteria bacterium]